MMPFSRIAESRIREAMEQGQFDNLPGAGQPLNLEEYFSTPEDLRMAYSILKNASSPWCSITCLDVRNKPRQPPVAVRLKRFSIGCSAEPSGPP
jgi:hypothetical protein